MQQLLFGTAGIPLCTSPRNTLEGIKQVKSLGLSAMELEFVQSVNVSAELAPKVKGVAKKEDVVLTCHGQYFVNLNATENEKIEASKKRILNAARRAFECGGWSVCFHAAFNFKDSPEKVYHQVKMHIKEIMNVLDDEGIKIWVRPETTGKGTQWGDLLEVVKLASEIESVQPCVDFSHLHARSNGKWNTLPEFREQLTLIEKYLGREALENMHIHVAGINYSEKGERNHLPLEESDMNYRDLAKAWKEFRIRGVVIAESPVMEKDALLLQKTYRK